MPEVVLLLCECLGVLCFTLLFTFTQCLSGQDVQNTAYQTDDHAFGVLEEDSLKKFLSSSKGFLLNILLTVLKKRRRQNRRRKGRCKHIEGYKEDHEIKKK